MRRVPVSDAVLQYALRMVRMSRPRAQGAPEFITKWVDYGGSVRAAQYLILGGKARALTRGRYHVSFEDVRALAHPVLRHRILTNFHAESERVVRRRDRQPAPGNAAAAFRDVGDEPSTGLRRRRGQVPHPVPRAVDPGAHRQPRPAVAHGGRGLHQRAAHSPFFGRSLDFAEHRQYMPGDDIRLIDWKLFARDRFYVKVRADTNCTILLDVSRSMSFAKDSISKLDYGSATCRPASPTSRTSSATASASPPSPAT